VASVSWSDPIARIDSFLLLGLLLRLWWLWAFDWVIKRGKHCICRNGNHVELCLSAHVQELDALLVTFVLEALDEDFPLLAVDNHGALRFTHGMKAIIVHLQRYLGRLESIPNVQLAAIGRGDLKLVAASFVDLQLSRPTHSELGGLSEAWPITCSGLVVDHLHDPLGSRDAVQVGHYAAFIGNLFSIVDFLFETLFLEVPQDAGTRSARRSFPSPASVSSFIFQHDARGSKFLKVLKLEGVLTDFFKFGFARSRNPRCPLFGAIDNDFVVDVQPAAIV